MIAPILPLYAISLAPPPPITKSSIRPCVQYFIFIHHREVRIALGFSLEGTVQSGGILVIGVIFCFLCFSFVFFIFCDNLNHDILIRLFLVFPLFCPSECIYSVLFLYKYYDIHVQVGKTQNI